MKQYLALIAGGYLLIAHAGAEELAGTWGGSISINGVPAMQATLVLTPNGTFTYTSISNAGTIMEERAFSTGTYRLTGDRLERHLTNWEPKQRCRPEPMGCTVVRMPEYVTETVALDGDRLVLTSVGVAESVKAMFKRR